MALVGHDVDNPIRARVGIAGMMILDVLRLLDSEASKCHGVRRTRTIVDGDGANFRIYVDGGNPRDVRASLARFLGPDTRRVRVCDWKEAGREE